jgi:hypothetical protein
MTTTGERAARPDWVPRLLSSPTFNAVIGIAGLLVPFAAWAVGKAIVKDLLLAVETLLVMGLSVQLIWLRRAFIQLRRANAKSMSDAAYFEAIRGQLESTLISDFDEIAEGRLSVFATEVPRISVLLYQVMLDSSCEPRRVSATDLTTDPRLLGQRREYLAINRKLVESGGVIQRVFICRLADLLRRNFAADLLELVAYHRSLGVQCGLSVREWLRPEQSVDFVVIGLAAALVEEEQGDENYGTGRSTVVFKNVRKWADRFTTIWAPIGSYSAVSRLQRYESAVKPMLGSRAWRPSAIRTSLEFKPADP